MTARLRPRERGTLALALGLLLTAVSTRPLCAQTAPVSAEHMPDRTSMLLVNRAEVAHGRDAVAWEVRGWTGTPRQRLWVSTEGSVAARRLDHGEAAVLMGRAVSAWWDVVGGLRVDREHDGRGAWGVVGVHGLAPYRFDAESTVAVSADGLVQWRARLEHTVLVTNRWIAQPSYEVEALSRYDDARGRGRGVGVTTAGLRVRYEIRREFAPYVGVTWQRAWNGTATDRRLHHVPIATREAVVGVRVWW